MTTIHHRPDPNLAGIGAGSADKAQAASGQAAQTQSQAQPGIIGQPGEVQITPTAQLLSNVEQQIAGAPDIDQSRVDAIRQALSNGSYQVDSGRIADGVIAANKFDAQAASGAASPAHANTVKAFATTARLGAEKG